ncbi:transcriptional regulator [bacterium 1xD8-6]|nr:transcriptional regulator [bacterium D16-36]RKI66032.1 transcriptional regulator [bacterium 1xD8-6]
MAKSAIIHEVCPIAQGINILSGKWKLQIIWFLSLKQTTRFNELQKSIGNITTKTLTQQLRELEEQKVVKRTIYPEVPPKVEYSLTEIGETLRPILKALNDWGLHYMDLANQDIPLEENTIQNIELE